VIVVIVEREVLCGEISLCCKIFSWVRRSTMQLGAQGGERRRERNRYMQSKSTYRTICFHIIYYKVQFCGCIPKERVNHIYLGIMCDFC
jgi:hypothetical protein